ncbi:atrial natriuretic peptide receptor 1-like [Paramacrobiotus metropolitanus]|uniref:atrial natriuretic peptide receptor 1-like n=1 Tax=Paramacrobiotus metropolitanus TaxID=2943436 RepID=UPI002445C8FA|nr:atrial natriuretic peptide receptor 1-like [Paramacrobiotus metropolitanus]
MHLLLLLLGVLITILFDLHPKHTVLVSLAPLNVQLVSFLPYNVPSTISLPFTGSALTLALQKVNHEYAEFLNISLATLFEKSDKTCADASATMPAIVADYYYGHARNYCIGLIGARWDTLIFTNGWVDRNYLSPGASPTAIALSGTYYGVVLVIIKLLRRQNWLHVSALLDTTAAPSYYTDMANALKMECARASPGESPIAADVLKFDGQGNSSLWEVVLRTAKKRSRIIIFFTVIPVMIKILRVAYPMGMGSGDYVFIVIEATQQAIYGAASLFDDPTSTSDMLIFRSVIYFTSRPAHAVDSLALNGDIARKTLKDYGTRYELGIQPFDLFSVAASYDSVEMLAWAVNQTLAEVGADTFHCSGKKLARRLINHDLNLTTGISRVTADGSRNLAMDIYGFNNNTKKMQLFMWYDPALDILRPVVNYSLSNNWPFPVAFPPPDIPLCGFSGAEGICSHQNDYWTPIGSSIAAVFVILAFVGVMIRRHAKSKVIQQWLLTDEQLVFDSAQQTVPPPTHNDDNFSSSATFRGTSVWAKRMQWDNLEAPVAVLHDQWLFPALARIDHRNVSRFIGLCISGKGHMAWAISSSHQRGSLDRLLTTMDMHFDWEFKTFLISDIIEGLLYIHTSPIKYHGFLALKKCLVDSHFTVAIGSLGFQQMKTTLNPSLTQHTGNKTNDRRNNKALPLRNASAISATQLLDITVLKKIVSTIFFPSPQERQSNNDLQRHTEINNTNPDMSIKRFVDSFDTTRYENISQIRIALHRMVGRQSKNVIESILLKVTAYAATLEESVSARTAELKAEQAKADRLLAEMLPRSIVESLRNKVAINPEYFDCVTISFSDMPGFVGWVATADIGSVIATLNTIYVAFDTEIQRFDVYKVETIGDTYMVASGLPVRNGSTHAVEISYMAKSLLANFETLGMQKKNIHLRFGVRVRLE